MQIMSIVPAAPLNLSEIGFTQKPRRTDSLNINTSVIIIMATIDQSIETTPEELNKKTLAQTNNTHAYNSMWSPPSRQAKTRNSLSELHSQEARATFAKVLGSVGEQYACLVRELRWPASEIIYDTLCLRYSRPLDILDTYSSCMQPAAMPAAEIVQMPLDQNCRERAREEVVR
jgi:hypothetical protein